MLHTDFSALRGLKREGALRAVRIGPDPSPRVAVSIMPIPPEAEFGFRAFPPIEPAAVHVVPGLTVAHRSIPRFQGAPVPLPRVLPGFYTSAVIPAVDRSRSAAALRRESMPGPAFVAFTTKWLEYGHFLIETLPKLLIVRELIDAGVVHPVIAPLDPPAWVAAFLGLLFREEELLRVDDQMQEVELGVGLVPTLLDDGSVFDPLLGTLIDKHLLAKLPAGRPRRLFVSRQAFRGTKKADFRAWANEQEVAETAVPYGFEIIAPERMTIPDQLVAFRDATHVVGEASSALHNMLFARAGAHCLSANLVNHVQSMIAAMRQQTIDYVIPVDGVCRSWGNCGAVPPEFRVDRTMIQAWFRRM